jgi:lipopolysaccharide biosynthesis regulator YciM
MLAISIWPLLLPVAAASGWWYAKRSEQKSKAAKAALLAPDYIVGLNYLLNEQHDKAIDIFLKLLTVDRHTVETHFALGSLFRRRGEVDRAIRIHQHLIARPELSPTERAEAMLALGRDYLSAGVLDRAEHLLTEVAVLNVLQATSALWLLLDLYQQEKSWLKAIDTALKIANRTGTSMQRIMSHHYCELSDLALRDEDLSLAKEYLERARAIDESSVRASLLQGKIAMLEQEFEVAIQHFQRIQWQAPEFLSEAIQPLGQCYQALQAPNELITYLHSIVTDYPRMSIVLYLAEQIRKQQNVDAAITFVGEFLQKKPSLRGLHRLIAWHLASSYGVVQDKLKVLHDITQLLLEKKPIYRCGSCGFAGKQLHWHCPGCKEWESVKPIHGLEGD